MERDHLVRLLDEEGEAFIACRQALISGARFWVSELSERASTLVRIYAHRDRHTRETGIPTLGFPAAVDALRQHGEQPIKVGAVDTEDPPYHFQLFLAEQLTSVVACLGVDQDHALLSQAVVTYVWGDGRLPWPSRRPEAVRIEFPDQADDLIMQVEEIIRLTDDVRPAGDLAEIADLAEAAVREHVPQLSETAVRAVGALFAYSWR